MMNVQIIPLLRDNYAYLLRADDGTVAVIDPSEPGGVAAVIEKTDLELHYILNTHHHGDHTGGNIILKNTYGSKVIGPAAEAGRIPGIDIEADENRMFKIGQTEVRAIETPGHTLGHISYYFEKEKMLFCGDTLFSLGCGRVFEGTMEQMWDSLQKLMKLPDDTMMFCGHEYTLGNARFCLSVEPENKALQERVAQAQKLRMEKQPTLPVSMGTEKATNVLLRAGNAQRFAELRELKDNYKPVI
jgi:hydroxyacylglutathione hydrolase